LFARRAGARDAWGVPFSEADRYRHQIDAELTLARMDLFEDLAQLHAEEACDVERARFAAMYRELLGFHPNQRDGVRRTLEHVQTEGSRPVPDIIADVARQSENLYPPPSGSAAAGL
jgi:hypothetical protein